MIKPLIIGISGRSCSGKSAASEEIIKQHPDILYINQDKFFKVHANNWESPDALRMDRLIYSLQKLKEGKSTHIPSHRWTEIFDKEVFPTKIILVEGYLLFVNPELNKLLDKKIWVDVSDQNIFWRRTLRDGNTNSCNYTMNVVIPESKKYEQIQRNSADFLIDGNKSKDLIINEIKIVLNSIKVI